MRLYLIRHPKPDIQEGVCYGSSDVKAVPEAETEALCRLAGLLPKHIPVYTSPLIRCASLALRLAIELDSGAPLMDSRLVELHFGNWEMQPWSSIAQAEVERWAADVVAYRPGSGETVLEAAQRIKAFYDDVLQMPHSEMIVVCHAGTIRLLLGCMENESIAQIAQAAAAYPHGIAYGEVMVVNCSNSKDFVAAKSGRLYNGGVLVPADSSSLQLNGKHGV